MSGFLPDDEQNPTVDDLTRMDGDEMLSTFDDDDEWLDDDDWIDDDEFDNENDDDLFLLYEFDDDNWEDE